MIFNVSETKIISAFDWYLHFSFATTNKNLLRISRIGQLCDLNSNFLTWIFNLDLLNKNI